MHPQLNEMPDGKTEHKHAKLPACKELGASVRMAEMARWQSNERLLWCGSDDWRSPSMVAARLQGMLHCGMNASGCSVHTLLCSHVPVKAVGRPVAVANGQLRADTDRISDLQ
jgi:hypothetical protein